MTDYLVSFLVALALLALLAAAIVARWLINARARTSHIDCEDPE